MRALLGQEGITRVKITAGLAQREEKLVAGIIALFMTLRVESLAYFTSAMNTAYCLRVPLEIARGSNANNAGFAGV